MQMTITSAASRKETNSSAPLASIVIIAAGILGSPAAPADEPRRLTTLAAAAPANAAVAAALPAAMLTTVLIEGSSAYQPPQLFTSYSDALGRPINRDAARAIVNAVADLYLRDGYVKPEVTLDDALARQGILRVRVYEAQISSVVVEGGGKFSGELERIGARLENARPLRRDDVPQALRDMRQFAGLAVTASTRRTSQRNAFDLVVNADFSPVDGVVRMNNRGTDQVGPAFLLGQLFANGLFGRGEKLGLIFAAATDHDEYLGGGLFFDSPLGSRGTRGNVLVFSSHSAPNEAPVNFDDEYTRQRLTLRTTHPLRQDARLTLSLGAAFEADNLTIDRRDVAIREDKLRVAETSLRATWPAGNTQLSANMQLRQGLDAFGAGLNSSFAGDVRRADFLAILAQVSVYRRFADRWSLRLDTFAQSSGYVLPDSERFKIGGDRLGRGFEVAEIAGDSGLGGKLELRRDLKNTESFIGRLSTYTFYDIGAAWKQDQPGRESAATAGIGFAMQGAELTGYLEIASPLTGPDIEGKREASVFAELSYRF
jgi:hemolysin activation/secretion protein